MEIEKTLQDTAEEVEEEAEVETEEETTEEEVDETEETTEEEDDYTPPTKEEYEKTLKERDNYKKGMLKAKSESKTKPSVKESEFVTKADLQKDKESRAIKEVLADNPEMDTDWTKFVGYIPKVSSSDDLEAIKKKIRAGYAGYKSTLDEETADEDKNAKAELSKTTGKGGKTPPPTQKEKKHILNTKSGDMASWYN